MKGVYIALGVILLLVLWGGCSYNGMNTARVAVNEKFAEVQSSYQRRSDLIPNLVETVKGSANFETKTLTDVIAARASATQVKIDASTLTPETMKQYQAAQGQLGQALGRLMVVSEQYPQLKASQSFMALQDQLEGTENRIKNARDNFNEATQDYNLKVTNFPGNLLAGMFGFKEKPMFEADQAAQSSPKVKF